MDHKTDPDLFLDETRKDLEEFIDIKTRLLKLEVTEKLAKTAGAAVAFFVLLIFVFILLNLLVFLTGIFLSSLLGSTLSGFATATGIYLVIFLLLIVFRKTLIILPVTNKVIRIFYDNHE